MIIILDSGIISTLCKQLNIPEVVECQKWFQRLNARGAYFTASELCDYEVRRELIRRYKLDEVQKLDELRKEIDFLPLTHEVILKASKLWAKARENHKPTSNLKNIDIDMFISAQWEILKEDCPGQHVIIATTNTKHLKLFAEAEEWENINF